MDRPRVHLAWRHLLVLTAFALGVLVQHGRAVRVGRDFSLGRFVAVGVVVMLVFAWMHVRRVRALPTSLSGGAELVGFTLGGFEVAGATTGVHRLVNTGVVGVVLLDGRLGVLIDRSDGGIVLSNEQVSRRLDRWRGRYWLHVAGSGREVAVRLWGVASDGPLSRIA